MSDRIRCESPLSRFELARRATTELRAAGGIHVRELAFLGYLNLRGDADQTCFLAAVRGVVGANLPVAPNTTSSHQGDTIFWLGPDEWLIVVGDNREAGIAQRLRDALRDAHFAVTDISSGLTTIELRGSGVCDLLAKECPLDFHVDSFAVGACGQSRLAKAPILVRRVANDTFEIVIRRSFADYVWLWLEQASAEYGLVVSV